MDAKIEDRQKSWHDDEARKSTKQDAAAGDPADEGGAEEEHEQSLGEAAEAALDARLPSAEVVPQRLHAHLLGPEGDGRAAGAAKGAAGPQGARGCTTHARSSRCCCRSAQ